MSETPQEAMAEEGTMDAFAEAGVADAGAAPPEEAKNGASTDSAVDDLLVVQIDRFHGPLDLLLHLIRTQDIDVFDIPISRITKQFLKAIEGMDQDALDEAGEFLEMAAALVRIKAQMLLPRHGDEQDQENEVTDQVGPSLLLAQGASAEHLLSEIRLTLRDCDGLL